MIGTLLFCVFVGLMLAGVVGVSPAQTFRTMNTGVPRSSGTYYAPPAPAVSSPGCATPGAALPGTAVPYTPAPYTPAAPYTPGNLPSSVNRPGAAAALPGATAPSTPGTAPGAATAAAAGAPLPPGRWEVHVTITVAGFQRTVPVTRRGEPLVLTTYAPGRIVVGDTPPPPPGAAVRAYRRLPWPVVGTLRRARAVAARRG